MKNEIKLNKEYRCFLSRNQITLDAISTRVKIIITNGDKFSLFTNLDIHKTIHENGYFTPFPSHPILIEGYFKDKNELHKLETMINDVTLIYEFIENLINIKNSRVDTRDSEIIHLTNEEVIIEYSFNKNYYYLHIENSRGMRIHLSANELNVIKRELNKYLNALNDANDLLNELICEDN